MPTKFSELFIDGIALEWEQPLSFWAYLLMNISHGKPILTQFSPTFVKA